MMLRANDSEYNILKLLARVKELGNIEQFLLRDGQRIIH